MNQRRRRRHLHPWAMACSSTCAHAARHPRPCTVQGHRRKPSRRLRDGGSEALENFPSAAISISTEPILGAGCQLGALHGTATPCCSFHNCVQNLCASTLLITVMNAPVGPGAMYGQRLVRRQTVSRFPCPLLFEAVGENATPFDSAAQKEKDGCNCMSFPIVDSSRLP